MNNMRYIASFAAVALLSGCEATSYVNDWFESDEPDSVPTNEMAMQPKKDVDESDFYLPPLQGTLDERYSAMSGDKPRPQGRRDFDNLYKPDSRDIAMQQAAEAADAAKMREDDDDDDGDAQHSANAVHNAPAMSYRNRLPTLFESTRTHKTLKDYVSQLAMQLMDRATRMRSDDLIGVVSFVNLDSQLTNTNPIGNQLAEYFIGEMQHFGVAVVDFKVGESIQVGNRGDFIFSRDADQLAEELAMDHILTGTLIYRSNGISVNARIIELSSKRVIATSNITIPDFVVADLNPYLTRR